MSTRGSILFLEADGRVVHLYEDFAEDYGRSGLHLDLEPVFASPDTGRYGDFAMGVDENARAHLSVRIPYEVCEAIADFVAKRREPAP